MPASNLVRRVSPAGRMIIAMLIAGIAALGLGLLVFGGSDVSGCFGVTGC